MNDMTVAQAWAIILGVVTPIIVAFVRKPTTSRLAAQLISLAVAVVIGIGNLAVQGVFNDLTITPARVLTLLAAVIGASQAAYVLLWKPTGVEPAIDGWTNETLYAGKHVE